MKAPRQRRILTDDERRAIELKWENHIDQAIREAQDRGDFDDLPGHGKPLNLSSNPLAGDRELAFHVLKNNGFAPEWIELDKTIRAEQEAMAQIIERVRQRLTELPPPPAQPGSAPATPPSQSKSWWQRLWPGQPGATSSRTVHPDQPALTAEHIRSAARRRYLEHAEALDRAIVQFNSVLPRDIYWLERPRPTLDQYATRFATALQEANPLKGDA